MFEWLKKPTPEAEAQSPASGFFSTDIDLSPERKSFSSNSFDKSFQKTISDVQPPNLGGEDDTFAMDSIQDIKIMGQGFNSTIPDAQLGYYASNGFIGYQTCAILAQNWLIEKACTMPARDAARNGYEITANDGTDVAPEILDYMAMQDKRFGINKQVVELVRMGRVFGIRIAMFKIESTDPEYYTKPFNLDGITAGSYKGISQIDPYWITPELSQTGSSDPSSMDFYEPMWWRINGKRIHKSHLIIMKNGEVPDVLKPTYLFGGVSVPQKLAERVYAAERTANEAPMLAMSKRLTVLNVDMAQAASNPQKFSQKMAVWTSFMNNYGVKVIGGEEQISQFDTALGDLDATIMTQYQLVAAAAEVPATKLLGTSPKGFNASGEFEESSYNQFLESVQYHDMSPLVERHHQILMRSHVAPKFKIAPFSTEINWKPVDSPTAAELADVNLKKSQTDAQLVQVGAIDGVDVRQRIIKDPTSGFNGLSDIVENMPTGEENVSDTD